MRPCAINKQQSYGVGERAGVVWIVMAHMLRTLDRNTSKSDESTANTPICIATRETAKPAVPKVEMTCSEKCCSEKFCYSVAEVCRQAPGTRHQAPRATPPIAHGQETVQTIGSAQLCGLRGQLVQCRVQVRVLSTEISTTPAFALFPTFLS